MEEIEESTNGSFCRLCLSTSVVYYSLEKNNGTEMLFSLTGIKIQEDNQYSTESCVKCWLDLKRAYSIQQKFIEFQAKFQLLGLDSIDSKIPETSLKNEKNPEEDISNISDLTNLIKMEVSEIENDSSNDKLELSNNSDDQFDYDELIYIKTNDECPIQIQTNCVICGVKCEDDTALYNHTNNHYNQEQTCDTCLIKLPNISSYRKHIEANHPEEANKTYCCGICTLSFRYLTLYDLHLAAVHPDTARSSKKRNKCNVSRFLTKSDENLTCDHCNKTFISKRSLKSHVKGHVRKPCPICSVEITVYNLSKHISSHTASPVVCHLCGLTSKNPESLRGHMYYTHSQKQIPCEICGRIFKKLYAHKMHMKKEHLGERSFCCDTCGKRFFTNYDLNTHIRSRHLKERKHICKYCQKGFASRFSMKTHERQHTNEAPYVCEMCGEGFRQNVSLRAHRKSKHNIVEAKKEECSICGKMFRDDWALKSHVRSVHD